MIIVRIVGGLGNQMFQYAYAKALQQKGYEVRIDISQFKNYKLHGGYQLHKYQIDLKEASFLQVLFANLRFIKPTKEKSLLFDKKLLLLQGNKHVKGYFQTEKYFLNIREQLIHQFTIKEDISNQTSEIAKKIKTQTNTCAVHIRRGDYVSNKKNQAIHGICSLEYYQTAIKLMDEKYKNMHYFIFSDDISWSKENLNIKNAIYVDTKSIPHEDLFLMSLCKHNITANSSFSWWGAWLNQHLEKTVIAPKKWFVSKENEIACSNWIKL